MREFFSLLEKKKIRLPQDVHDLLSRSRSFRIFSSVEDLAVAAAWGPAGIPLM